MRQGFGVHVGHVEKTAQRVIELTIMAQFDGAVGHAQGHPVRGVDVGASPEDIAWNLVEQQNKCQRSFRVNDPVGPFPARGRHVQCQKLFTTLGIKGFASPEPSLGPGFLPEVNHVLRCLSHFCSLETSARSSAGRCMQLSYQSGLGSPWPANCWARRGERHTPPASPSCGSTAYQNQRPSASWASQFQPWGASDQEGRGEVVWVMFL